MALYERRASIQYGGHTQLPAPTNSTALHLHQSTDSRAYSDRVSSSSTTLWSGYNFVDTNTTLWMLCGLHTLHSPFSFDQGQNVVCTPGLCC